jgi:hypothetical protein
MKNIAGMVVAGFGAALPSANSGKSAQASKMNICSSRKTLPRAET